MKQKQIANHLVGKAGISLQHAKLTLDELAMLVVRELKQEGSIHLAGLGIFRKRTSEPRIGHHPATGEQIKIPARMRLCASHPSRH
jgi:nucleoid DNA-binding protein